MAKVSSISRTNTTHTITEVVNGQQHEFEVTFEPSSYNDIHVKISDDGKRAVVGYLTRDNNPGDPRKEFDQIDHMICLHSRYNLGDKHSYRDSDDFYESLCREAVGDDDKFDRMTENLDKRIEKVRGSRDFADRSYWRDIDALKAEFREKILDNYCVMLPCCLYDHSGISMSTGSFNDRWDSGQVGYIYMTWQAAWDNFGAVPGRQARTKQWLERIVKSLEASVKEYDMYLTGDVWGVCTQFFVNVAEEGDDPEWKSYDDGNHQECWGFYGDKYAEEELKSWVENCEEWLTKPLQLTPPPSLVRIA